jgi:cell division septation protein DedD
MTPPAAQGAAATATTATSRPAVTPPAPRAGTPQAGEPAAAPPARPRTAAIAPSAEGAANGFVVQLSSQKTESEAQSSFRSLQAKFPNELGSRQPIIRRADLGTKGVFYRTMIGPFASAQEASQFCATYKAAGGQCVVPNN